MFQRKTEQEWQENLLPFSSHSGQLSPVQIGIQRGKWLRLLVLALFLTGVLRSLQLMVSEHDQWLAQAQTNYERVETVPAPRGEIYDRSGQPLAINQGGFQLIARRSLLPAEEMEQIFFSLAEITNIPATEFVESWQQQPSQERVVLLHELESTSAFVLLEQINQFPGVSVETIRERVYPTGEATAHVVGYLAELTSTEFASEENYSPGEWVGRTGSELQLESWLRGQNGEARLQVDALGQAQSYRIEPGSEPQSGHSVQLTIDADWQQYLYELVQQTVEEQQAQAGVVIAMDVRTGAVRAMVSYPSFDNNAFVSTDRVDERQQLLSAPAGNPLFHRAVSGQYPPASTFKLFVAAGALQENVIQPNQKLFAQGFLREGNDIFPDWIYPIRGYGFGWMDMVDALVVSSDVYFYQIGAGYQRQPGLGSDQIVHYAKQFGYGQPTSFQIPAEAAGLMASEQSFAAEGRDWFWGNTAHMSIGQGYLLATPLQMAVSTAAIANGGQVLEPQLVERVVASNGSEVASLSPNVKHQVGVDAEHLQLVGEAMRQSVNRSGGTGYQVRNLPIAVAGKTGTAQHDETRQNHAWFTSYAPYEDPEIALVVLIEEGGEGSLVAAPVARDAWQWYVEHTF